MCFFQVRTELLSSTNLKKLQDHQTRINSRQKHKEQSQKRRSYNSGAAIPTAQLAQSSKRPPSQTTYSIGVSGVGSSKTVTESKKRKGSSSLASGAPWNMDSKPRFHDDPYTAVSALLHTLDTFKSFSRPTPPTFTTS